MSACVTPGSTCALADKASVRLVGDQVRQADRSVAAEAQHRDHAAAAARRRRPRPSTAPSTVCCNSTVLVAVLAGDIAAFKISGSAVVVPIVALDDAVRIVVGRRSTARLDASRARASDLPAALGDRAGVGSQAEFLVVLVLVFMVCQTVAQLSPSRFPRVGIYFFEPCADSSTAAAIASPILVLSLASHSASQCSLIR